MKHIRFSGEKSKALHVLKTVAKNLKLKGIVSRDWGGLLIVSLDR
jgi:hypothetical protein